MIITMVLFYAVSIVCGLFAFAGVCLIVVEISKKKRAEAEIWELAKGTFIATVLCIVFDLLAKWVS